LLDSKPVADQEEIMSDI